ncbi:LysM peptidoglycan-binding domain-containing protein, partial [Flavobacterium sp. LBUM151]
MILRLIVVLFFFSCSVFSQEKYIKHTISKGDNITSIAKKYGVKPKAITDANPNAPKILKLNSVLLIPNTNQTVAAVTNETAVNNTPGTHEVLAKETLWGISKKYNVSVEDLKTANPLLETEGLKIGQQITIPSTNNTVAVSEKPIDDLKIVTDVEVVV